MLITYEKFPTCFWHSDCEVAQGNGVMREVKREPERTLFECLHCGKRGYYPVGKSGLVSLAEQKLS